MQAEIGGIKKDKVSNEIKAKILEATDGNPHAEMIRVSVLGVFDKEKNPHGVECGKDLQKTFRHVVFPQSMEEAEGRLNERKALLTHAGVSTEKGKNQGGTGEPAPVNEHAQGESRLKHLSGIGG